MTKPEGGYLVCLTPYAERDLEGIWIYTAGIWSVEPANNYVNELVAKFDLLAKAPFIARERAEFNPPVRIQSHKSHVIIYRVIGSGLQIIRIAHMRQNWAAFLR